MPSQAMLQLLIGFILPHNGSLRSLAISMPCAYIITVTDPLIFMVVKALLVHWVALTLAVSNTLHCTGDACAQRRNQNSKQVRWNVLQHSPHAVWGRLTLYICWTAGLGIVNWCKHSLFNTYGIHPGGRNNSVISVSYTLGDGPCSALH